MRGVILSGETRRSIGNQTLASRMLLLALTLAVAGCIKGPPISSRFQTLWEEPDGPPISRRVVLLADNQTHHLYGDPVWIRSEFTDRWVASAIRAVQLDLYGPDLFRWIVAVFGAKDPVIHLGDALDISCAAEFDTFVGAMRSATRPWFMAPGNHDGFYFGNGHFAELEWARACERGGGPLTKADFIRRYLEVLFEQNDPGAKALAADVPRPIPFERDWRYQGAERALLHAVAWKIDTERPWRSYLIQELDLTLRPDAPVSAILLDTSQYELPPRLIPIPPFRNAGLTGSLRRDQLTIVHRWLQRTQRMNALAVLMGHHPYGSLDGPTRRATDPLWREASVLLYVSAHTHRGSWMLGSDWPELNVGSAVDWPIHFRSFALGETPGTPPSVYVRSPQFLLGRLWLEQAPSSDEDPSCDPAWQARSEDPDFYVGYVTHAALDPAISDTRLMNALLSSYRRLLLAAPSDAANHVWPPNAASDKEVLARISAATSDSVPLLTKITLLEELRAFDQARAARNPKAHRDFRLCSALWASQDDEKGARIARPDEWFVVFPKDR